MSRMMIYAHYDPLIKETKFGDHFVKEDMSYEDAVAHTIRYMRSQYPRRAQYFDSDEVKKRVWDISEFAKEQDRFYGASKIDDVIRPNIGYQGKQGREYHRLGFEELCFKVDEFLKEQNQPLIVAGLSTAQFEAALETVQAFTRGAKTILADLCARFGKTIWSASVAVEEDTELVVVASYIKTVFASFANDIVKFEQFREYVHVDMGDADYQNKIDAAFKKGKRVFAYISLCSGSKRKERFEYIFGLKQKRMLIIDEADFGAHRDNQGDLMRSMIQENDKVIIMTGTNSDRAARKWNIDHVIHTNYFELLAHKKEAMEAA